MGDLRRLAERIYRLERIMADGRRTLAEIQASTLKLGQWMREVETEVIALGVGAVEPGGGDGPEPTLIKIKLVNSYGVPINAAKLKLSLARWPIGSGDEQTYGGGEDDPIDWPGLPDPGTDYAFFEQWTSVSGSDGIVEYDLQTGNGELTPAGSWYDYREMFGSLKRPTIGPQEIYGKILSTSKTGYLAYGPMSNQVSGPPTPDPTDLSTSITTAIAPGSLYTLILLPRLGYRVFAFTDRAVAESTIKGTDQYASGFATNAGYTRSTWNTWYILTGIDDGNNGYKLRIMTSKTGYPTVDEYFATSSRGIVSGKVRLVYDTAGSTTAARIYASGSTEVTLDEV